ncbi:MAG: DinB family protein [Gemmatimonadota bacterium]
MFDRPQAGEFLPYYATYIDQVPDGDVLDLLATQIGETERLIRTFLPDREAYRYAPDKWSVREVLGHIIDAEWVFSLRALWFARSDPSPLPGFDQDIWAEASNAGDRPLEDLLREWRALRAANLETFRGLGSDVAMRRGVANGYEVTVRALIWVTAGHERHHQRLLRERYGAA